MCRIAPTGIIKVADEILWIIITLGYDEVIIHDRPLGSFDSDQEPFGFESRSILLGDGFNELSNCIPCVDHGFELDEDFGYKKALSISSGATDVFFQNNIWSFSILGVILRD